MRKLEFTVPVSCYYLLLRVLLLLLLMLTLMSAGRNQEGFLADSSNYAGLIATKPSKSSHLWVVSGNEPDNEEGALSALEERARTQAKKLAGQKLQEARVPQYQSVEEGALASIAAEAQEQLKFTKERTAREAQHQRRRNAATRRHAAVQNANAREHDRAVLKRGAPVSSSTPAGSSKAAKSDKYHLTERDDGTRIKMASEPKPKYTWRDDGAKLLQDGHVAANKHQHATSLGASAMQIVSMLAKAKAHVREEAKLKLQRQAQLARVARWDDELTQAKRDNKKLRREVLHLVEATSTSDNVKKSVSNVGSGVVGSKEAAQSARTHTHTHSTSTKLMWPGEQDIKWPGEREYKQHAAAEPSNAPAVSCQCCALFSYFGK
jgi:hypothetical protein